jgi:hypothetical protein
MEVKGLNPKSRARASVRHSTLRSIFSLMQLPRLLLCSAAACPHSLLPLLGRCREEHQPTWSSTTSTMLAHGGHRRPPHLPPPSSGLGLRAATRSMPRPTPPSPWSTAAPADSSTTPIHHRPPTANSGKVLLLADPLSSISFKFLVYASNVQFDS